MIVESWVTHTIKMGDFESLKRGAKVTIDTGTDTDGDNWRPVAQSVLDGLLKEDLALAAAAQDPEVESYLSTWIENKEITNGS